MKGITTEDNLRYLEVKETAEGSLSTLLEFYKQLLQIHTRVESRITHIPSHLDSQDGEAVSHRHHELLLDIDEIMHHIGLLWQTFQEVAICFAQFPDFFGNIPRIDSTFTTEEAKAWLKSSELPSSITCTGIKTEVLQVIMQSTFKPFLSSYAQFHLPRLDQESWRRNYCPVCGGCADFAYIDKEGARWLICARCDATWLFQRLECPTCCTQDQNALSYFTDDDSSYRLYVCEKCKHYLKAVDMRQAKEDIPLMLERLYTLELDASARQLGYSSPILTLPILLSTQLR